MDVTPARKLAVSIAAVMMMMAIPAVRTGSVAASIALVSVAMAGYQAGLANMLAMPADVFPAEAVASVYGIASMGSGIGGMIFVMVTGWMVDHISYVPVFWMFGLIPVICSAILWLVMGRLQHEELPAAIA
jgi:ACS family hexuronate transporter-like MFS transporter